MACRWLEGFETHIHADQIARKYASAAGDLVEEVGAFGRAVSINASVVTTRDLGVSGNVCIFGVRVLFNEHDTTIAVGAQGFYIDDGGSEQLHIEMETQAGPQGRFKIYRGSTLIDTTAWIDQEWTYVEFKFTVRNGVNGAYEVKIDGVADISGTGVNLANTAVDGWDTFGWIFANDYTAKLLIDDIYVFDGSGSDANDFPATSAIIKGAVANEDGATLQWVPSGTGGHFADVDDPYDEAPDDVGEGGFVRSNTDGHRELFGLTNIDDDGTIIAVQLNLQIALELAGSRIVKATFRASDTTIATGPDMTVDSTTYREHTTIWENDPAASAPWEGAEIDASQFGFEVVS